MKAGKGAKPRQRVGGKRSAGEADVLAASHIPPHSVPAGRPSKAWINKSSCPQTTKQVSFLFCSLDVTN